MLTILALIGGALAVGAVVYLAVKLTISVIKNFRKRKNSKIVATDMKEIMKALAKDSSVGHVSFDDLDDDDTVVAEYDEENDEIVQTQVATEKDDKVDSLLKRNNGVVIIED